MNQPVWIIFDGRAANGDTDDAAVLETFGYDGQDIKTDDAAIKYAQREWKDHELCLYRYDLTEVEGRQMPVAENERLIHYQQIKQKARHDG